MPWLYIAKEDAKRSINISSSSDDIIRYLKGDVIEANVDNGWCLILVDGYPIGWGKSVNGIIKNHFPKGLRW